MYFQFIVVGVYRFRRSIHNCNDQILALKCIRCPVFPEIEKVLRHEQIPEFPCLLPKSVGPCTQSLHRFYFNDQSQTCEAFVFGGCRGNSNNFITLQDCNERCKPASNTTNTLVDNDTSTNVLEEKEAMDSSKHNQTCTLPREEVSKKNKIGMDSRLENDLMLKFSGFFRLVNNQIQNTVFIVSKKGSH